MKGQLSLGQESTDPSSLSLYFFSGCHHWRVKGKSPTTKSKSINNSKILAEVLSIPNSSENQIKVWLELRSRKHDFPTMLKWKSFLQAAFPKSLFRYGGSIMGYNNIYLILYWKRHLSGGGDSRDILTLESPRDVRNHYMVQPTSKQITFHCGNGTVICVAREHIPQLLLDLLNIVFCMVLVKNKYCLQ